ncbi:hypothetical protein RM780_07575 [Streptomyces sp. DSM 44917]|uniref:Transcriptional regulator n=1 Tax=Streptomyces boetiae TaxID=3075541 RepID=A0ABU2L5V3_9ACTN|nr:hypothetical protein [Streptomyces sp. DSM 44917]MDT0306821.1 hypothetical protein [Streptomyces sp. DSM 44917]
MDRVQDSLPLWLPSAGQGVQVVPCHRWFDAVRVPGFVGVRVVALLRRAQLEGAVIEDQVGDSLTWLVRVGAADGWDAFGAEVLGAGQSVAVPPARFVAGAFTGGAGLRWLIAPSGVCLAEPGALRAAVRGAFWEVRRGRTA